MKKFWVFAAPLLALNLAACQSVPQPQAPSDAPPAVPEDLTERYVHQTIFAMRDSFNARDVEAFMRHVSDGFYRGRVQLLENLRGTFSASPRISLTVVIGDMKVDDQKVTVPVRWSREDVRDRTGPALTTSGESVLIFHKTDKIRLVDYRGDSLFGVGRL